jgi:hypothetical protein
VLKQLLSGAEVEPGVHAAEIEETIKNGKRVQRLRVH